MADIRIKDLATTAASSASDDYVAIDGASNGTRKLSAYSPTFGGNLTVSGTGYVGGNFRSDGYQLVGGATTLFIGGERQAIYSATTDTYSAWQQSSGITAVFGVNASGAYAGSFTNQSFILRTNNNPALTLDSSQNATFAGTGAQSIAGVVKFSAPSNIGAGTYAWIGGDGSTGMFLNAPTGSTVQFGVNNSGKLIVNSTTIKIVSIPTSSAGLPAGSVWNDGGTLKIV